MVKKALFVFVLLLCLMLSSCSLGQVESTDIMLTELLAISGEDFENNGSIYLSDASQGDLGYLSIEERSLMYGENFSEKTFDKIENYAIFSCARTPGEIAIFKCYSRSDTDEVVRMCLERADEIKVLLKNSEWGEKSEGISVKTYKKYVLFCFSDNSEKIEKKFRRLV